MSHSFQQRSFAGSEGTGDVVSTPEGDNEYAPGEPVGGAEGLQVPNGNAPIPYDTDVNSGTGNDGTAKVNRDQDRANGGEEHKGEVEKTVDKLSLGQILT